METHDSYITRNAKAETLLDLVGLLYDAAAEPARWQTFLEAGARYFDAFGGNFIRYLPEQPERCVGYLTGYGDKPLNLQADAIQRFVSLRHDDPRLAFGFKHPAQPFHCRQVVSTENLHASKSYREVLLPNNVEYALLVTIKETATSFTGLAFMRGPSGKMFTSKQVDDLARLVPHLWRALSIQDRLQTTNQRTQASYGVLDALPTGIAILLADGRIEYINRAAQAIFAMRDGIAIDHDNIELARNRDNQLFYGGLHRVAQTGELRALKIERPSGKAPLRCLLSLMNNASSSRFSNLLAESRIALYLSDPEQSIETPDELLQMMFGLTLAEARLVSLLVAGRSLSEAAVQMRVRLSTIRTHLKSVFRKTGIDSQAALIRTVMSSPAWMSRGVNQA